jgi:hypothetical protein
MEASLLDTILARKDGKTRKALAINIRVLKNIRLPGTIRRSWILRNRRPS